MKNQLFDPEYSLHDELVATILVVEDDPEINALMSLTLRVEDYEVLQARDGGQALKILAGQTPDLILMDVMMPRMSGYELARILQGQSATRHIPIIFVTAKSEMEDRVRGLEMAIDYVCKPFAAPELIARVRAALRMSRLQEQLRASNQKLVQMATTDSLTGLCNRRHFYFELELEIQRASRFNQPLSLVIFDLDFFKQINDSWGHAQGDRVLQEFARVLDGARRHIDTVARLGGEEFVALLPGTNSHGASVFAEKVRRATENLSISCRTFDGDQAPNLQVTVSAGAATVLSNTAFLYAN
ncbi:MAG TPA: diguanylate cyclase, partial [Abditibacteriaceae bacterium]|nr:diguanylate cyclase [Abditibacteriaceae bacterium]